MTKSFWPLYVGLVIFLLRSVRGQDGHDHTAGAQDGNDDVGEDNMMMMEHYDDFRHHPCRRDCQTNGKPMVCEYMMSVDWYSTMSRACFYCPNRLSDCDKPGCIAGSGTQKAVIVANRQLPGPSIEVCLGDIIRVTVENMAKNDEALAIHWHGIHQKGTQYMDGVPMITQCPITPGTNFTYEFEADQTGTYFWHAHTGLQRGDGLAGSLIIRDPKDPHRHLYDRDDLHPVITQDWFPGQTFLNNFATFWYAYGELDAPQILFNGRWPTHGLHSVKNLTLPPLPVPVPPFVYNLNPKLRYRFRITNNAMHMPMKFEITGHNMIVIASDGFSVKPVLTKTLIVMPAERYDVIPYPTGEHVSRNAVYYIHVQSPEDEETDSFAKIVYKGGKNPKWRLNEKLVKQPIYDEVNRFNFEEDEMKTLKAAQLQSISPNPDLEGEPDVTLITEIELDRVNNPMLYPNTYFRGSGNRTTRSPRINKITNLMEPPVPLLSQWDELPKDMLCNAEHRQCPPEEFCECIHLEAVPYGALVEMIIVDNGITFPESQLEHPMHIHGFHFGVVAQESVHPNLTGAEVLKMDKQGLIKRKVKYAPLKDVIGVPTGGYVIIRYRADNPGFWFFHCHIDSHMIMGMSMIIRVGKQSDLPPIPPKFPRCQSWKAPRRSPMATKHQQRPMQKRRVLKKAGKQPKSQYY